MPSHLSHRGYIAILTVSSAVILALGVLLKPAKLPEPTVSGEELMRLQTLTQRKNLENLAVYFSGVADGIQPGLVWLNELGMTGVVWNGDRLIVTAGPKQPVLKEVTAITVNGNMSLQADVVSQNFRASSLKAPPESQLQPVRRGKANGLTPGVWILEVARQAGGTYLFTPGIFGGVSATHCGTQEYQSVQSSLPLTDAALGGGLFDVDGNLLAMVLRCGDHLAALTLDDVAREIARANSFAGQLMQFYGLTVTSLDGAPRKFLQLKEGALVSEIADGQLADVSGLLPGDVIRSLDKAPVHAPEDLRPLTQQPQNGAVFQLEVTRNGTVKRFDLRPYVSVNAADRNVSQDRGVVLADETQGYVIESVAPGSRAERANIQSGDRLLTINGKTPQGAADVRKALSDMNRDPARVLLHRGSRKLEAWLNE